MEIKKLLLISGEFPPTKTGDANHAYYTALNLAQRGIEVHVLTSAVKGALRHPNFQVHPIMHGWSWRRLPRFRRIVKRLAPDAILEIYVGRMYGYRSMMTFAPTIAKRILPSVRFVTQFEWIGDHEFWKKTLTERIVRKAMVRSMGTGIDYYYGTLVRDSDHIIVLSDSHRERLIQEIALAKEKTSLIPPAPLMTLVPEIENERERGRAMLGVKPEEFLFVNYGYILPAKGLETLFQALQRISNRRPEVRLAFIGGNGDSSLLSGANGITEKASRYADDIRKMPARLGIADRVLWAGPFPTGDDRASFLVHAGDAGILPFDDGVFLNRSSFVAVAAHGLPIITTRGETLERQFLDQENVYLCPPQNVEALASAMEEVVARADLRSRLSRGIQILSEQWFSWDKVIERTLNAFAKTRET